MTVYLNWRGPQGRETLDELTREDFASVRDFWREVRRLVGEYTLAGMAVYPSRRACKGWN